MFKPERFQLEFAWIIKIRIKPLISDYIGLTGFVLCANASAHSLLQIISDIVMVRWSHLYKKPLDFSKSSTHVSNEHAMPEW